jgi:isoleucyl-tRNA synthetase
VPVEALEDVDKYILARYAAVERQTLTAYNDYDFSKIFQAVNAFTTVDLSAFYADVSKDRLYTFAAASPERRSAQTAMYTIADGLVRLLAPILSITSDELWRHLPGRSHVSVHVAEFPAEQDLIRLRDESLERRWEVLLDARSAVNAKLEELREKKSIGSSLQATVTLDVSDAASAALLKRYASSLPMLFIVSRVALGPAASSAQDVTEPELDAALNAGGSRQWTVSVSPADGEKCPRCWRIVPSVSEAPNSPGLCARCVDALSAGGAAA